MLRSVIAVVVGFLFIALCSVLTGQLILALMPGAFDADGRTERVPVLLLTLAYVGVFAVAGCYLTARLAPSRPLAHALVLGALGLVFNIMGSIAMWHTAPAWYHLLGLSLVMPYAWLGGRLREAQLAEDSAPA